MSGVDSLRSVGESLIAARDELNKADSAAGDGDLGNTVATIGETLIALAPELVELEPVAALRRLGTEIGSRAPSTFGTLVSIGFVGAARSLGAGDAPDAEPTALEEAARFVRAIDVAITARGKATRGGKTMLDALGPAADALETAAESGVTPAEGFSLALLAALEGVEETRGMEPTMGRQAWLADRSRGSVDPGALAVALTMRAIAQALA